MTMRVNISIVPFGNEDEEYGIFRLDISNIGVVKDLGFGNTYCRYIVKVYKVNNKTMQRVCGVEEFEFLFEDFVEEHNRRDGPISLVNKATKLIEDRI